AHRVLHRELVLDDPAEPGVAAQPVADRHQAGDEVGLGGREAGGGVGLGGVDRRAARQHEPHRAQGPVGGRRERRRHAGGVVRDDAADRAGDLARRVGAEPPPVPGEERVDAAQHGAGLAADPGPAVEHLDAGERVPGVDEDAVGARLAGEAGAAGAERHRDPGAVRGDQGTGQLAQVARRHDGGRGQQVVGGVVGRGRAVHEPGRPGVGGDGLAQRVQRGGGDHTVNLVRRRPSACLGPPTRSGRRCAALGSGPPARKDPAMSTQPPYGRPNEQQPYGPPSYGQPGFGPAPVMPGAPWPSVPTRRPGTVTAGAVMAFIGGAFMVVVGLVLALLSGSAEMTEAITETYGPGMGSAATILGVALAVVGALIIVFGAMAFTGRQWGAVALAVITGLSLVGTITDIASGTGGSVVGLSWSIVATALLLSSGSRAWYRTQQR